MIAERFGSRRRHVRGDVAPRRTCARGVPTRADPLRGRRQLTDYDTGFLDNQGTTSALTERWRRRASPPLVMSITLTRREFCMRRSPTTARSATATMMAGTSWRSRRFRSERRIGTACHRPDAGLAARRRPYTGAKGDFRAAAFHPLVAGDMRARVCVHRRAQSWSLLTALTRRTITNGYCFAGSSTFGRTTATQSPRRGFLHRGYVHTSSSTAVTVPGAVIGASHGAVARRR